MSGHNVVFFSPYPFDIGQRIYIEEGPRRGDWEVVGLSEHKVTLRCPVSLREFKWDRFCYHVDERTIDEWPQKD